MRELFRQVSDPHPAVGDHRLSALPVSIAVHVLVLLAVVVMPLLASDILPAVRVGEVIFTSVVPPQVPSAPPVLAARRAAPLPVTNANAAPVEPPSGVNPELPVAPVPDVAAPGLSGVVSVDLPPGLDRAVVTEAPPPEPAAPVRVHSLLRPPVKIHDVLPVYPEAARLARVEGLVIIEAVIGPTGSVAEARVLRSKPLLDQAAIDAVRQWKYTPTLLNGIPVPVIMTVTVNFTLK
jgi:protein TonB